MSSSYLEDRFHSPMQARPFLL